MTLRERILKAAEFDADTAEAKARIIFEELCPHTSKYSNGEPVPIDKSTTLTSGMLMAIDQHSRLIPLITSLADCAEALDACRFIEVDGYPFESEVAKKALAALERELGGVE